MVGHLRCRGVREHQQGDEEKVGEDEQEHEALPSTEASRRRHEDEAGRRDGDGEAGAHVEVAQREADSDELGGHGEEVQDEEVDHRDHAPRPAVALTDQPGVALTGDGPEADHHLLVDDQDRDEQRQRPQEREAEVLPRLGIGRHAARVVVGDHDDDPRTEDGEQREQARLEAASALGVMGRDGAERTRDLFACVVRRGAGHLSPPRLWACMVMSRPPARRRSAPTAPSGGPGRVWCRDGVPTLRTWGFQRSLHRPRRSTRG